MFKYTIVHDNFAFPVTKLYLCFYLGRTLKTMLCQDAEKAAGGNFWQAVCES